MHVSSRGTLKVQICIAVILVGIDTDNMVGTRM